MKRGAGLVLAVAAGVAFGAPTASAQNYTSPPDFDTPAYCRQYASLTGAYVEALYGACLEEEAVAVAALDAIWRTILPAIASQCFEVALMGGIGSYTILKQCIDDELLTLATTPPYRPQGP